MPPFEALNIVQPKSRTGKDGKPMREFRVKSDQGEGFNKRVPAMARQLRKVEADVILHQEVLGAQLQQLLRDDGWGGKQMRAVEATWYCPISYDPEMVVPVYAARVVVGSRPSSFVFCDCEYTQWITSCDCWKRRFDSWRSGGCSLAAFRLRGSPRGTVDFVAVSVHLTAKQPETRTRGAREVLAPLVRLLAAKWGAPVVVGGDFNYTKKQSRHAHDKRSKESSGVRGLPPRPGGVYDELVGNLEKLRERFKARESSKENGSDCDEEDFEEQGASVGPCADTWEVAVQRAVAERKSKTSRANSRGCYSSTCHNWHGKHPGYQAVSIKTQGCGANSIVCKDRGTGRESKFSTVGMVETPGSARFIDWLLVDRAALAAGRVKVERADVWTAPATGREFLSYKNGYGSDHYPISVDIEFA